MTMFGVKHYCEFRPKYFFKVGGFDNGSAINIFFSNASNKTFMHLNISSVVVCIAHG